MTDKLVIYECKDFTDVQDLLDGENPPYVVFVDWARNEVYALIRGDWESA